MAAAERRPKLTESIAAVLRLAGKFKWAGRLCGVAIAAVLIVTFSGCQAARFYRQAISGQYRILTERQPIADLMADERVDAGLKRKFELVTRLRAFAESELKLPIDKHYLTYVDLGRRFVVWNVHAAPAFSLEPRAWWYPFVGRLKYRGYFNEADALRHAEQLARAGEDAYVEGVEAYSTLGWFADPLLNTFIHHPEPVLAEIIFHELAHQRLFVSGDTDFNEAFATTAAEEGVRRWLLAAGNDGGYREYLVAVGRNSQFVDLIMETRRQLEILYGESGDRDPFFEDPARAPVWMREGKARIIAELRQKYAALKESWGLDSSGYDGWFAKEINNAQLNTIAVYYELVPGFRALLAREGRDPERFYNAVEALGELGKEERLRRLRDWGSESDAGLSLNPAVASPGDGSAAPAQARRPRN